MVGMKKIFALLTSSVLVLSLTGCGGYRYECQNSDNWDKPQCNPPKCMATGECSKDIIGEKAWAEYLFSKGVVIGLNAEILKDFVDYTAFNRLKDIGIKYNENHPKHSPIPWFNKHVNINKKQSALQETESTNYVIGVMSDVVDYEELGQFMNEKDKDVGLKAIAKRFGPSFSGMLHAIEQQNPRLKYAINKNLEDAGIK